MSKPVDQSVLLKYGIYRHTGGSTRKFLNKLVNDNPALLERLMKNADMFEPSQGIHFLLGAEAVYEHMTAAIDI